MKQTLAALGVVAVMTAGIVAFVVRDEAARSKRLTAEAEAVGFVATPAAWWDGEENQRGHTLTYAWVDGANTVHPESMEQVSWYDPARRYKVCYNPADPADRKLYPSDHVCGQ